MEARSAKEIGIGKEIVSRLVRWRRAALIERLAYIILYFGLGVVFTVLAIWSLVVLSGLIGPAIFELVGWRIRSSRWFLFAATSFPFLLFILFCVAMRDHLLSGELHFERVRYASPVFGERSLQGVGAIVGGLVVSGPRQLVLGWRALREAFSISFTDVERLAEILGSCARFGRKISEDALGAQAYSFMREQGWWVPGVIFLNGPPRSILLTTELRNELGGAAPNIEEEPVAQTQQGSDEVAWAHAMLELKPPADLGKVKTAYRRAAKRVHPDVAGEASGNGQMSSEAMANVNLAYEILMEHYS